MLELAAGGEAQYALRIPGAPVDRVNIAITIVDDDTAIAREPEPQPPESNAPRPLDAVALPAITEMPGAVITDALRVLERRVAASEDDAEENLETKSVGVTSDDLELVDLGTTRQRAGLRFANLE